MVKKLRIKYLNLIGDREYSGSTRLQCLLEGACVKNICPSIRPTHSA